MAGFVVTIPLNDNPIVLGKSYELAKRRSLKYRFRRYLILKKYIYFKLENECLGHMK